MIYRSVILVACFLGGFVMAHPGFMDLIPNGHNVPNPCANISDIWHGVGHRNESGGGAGNLFGIDFLQANNTWTPELCQKDSDHDGRSNGVELGDADCKWVVGGTPEGVATGHPGVCEPMSNTDRCGFINSLVDCIKPPLKVGSKS